MHTTQSYSSRKILTYGFADFALKNPATVTSWPLELIVCFTVITDGLRFRYEHNNTSPHVGFKAMVRPRQNIILDTPHKIPFK
jgi:hypothetical protein